MKALKMKIGKSAEIMIHCLRLKLGGTFISSGQYEIIIFRLTILNVIYIYFDRLSVLMKAVYEEGKG